LRVVVGQQAAQVKQLHCSQVQPVERQAVDGPRQNLPFGFRDQRRRAWLQLEGPESKQSREPPSSLCRLGGGQHPDRLPPLDLDQGFELGQRRYRDIRFLADDFTRPDGLGLGEEQLEQCAGIDVQAHEEAYRSRSSCSSSSEEGWVGSPFEIFRSQRMCALASKRFCFLLAGGTYGMILATGLESRVTTISPSAANAFSASGH